MWLNFHDRKWLNSKRPLTAASYSSLNRTEEAQKAVKEVLRIDPNFSLKYYAMTIPYKHQENTDKFVEGLRKAGLPD